MSENAGWPLGHLPLDQPLDYRKELRRLRLDPLAAFIAERGGDRRFSHVFQDTTSRYEETFDCYYHSLKRFLPEQSLARRWLDGPYYKRKHGSRYTLAEQQLATRFNAIAPFLYLDFYNCLIWARILLDRMIALSRYFLTEKNVPSFYSFADHRRFFQRLQTPYGTHEEYADYIRRNTSWFDQPLKHIRDLYLVHSSPPHSRIFGHPVRGGELSLIVHPTPVSPEKPPVIISVSRLSHEIYTFQRWFGQYALRSVRAPEKRANRLDRT
jgi:hypothetical protein